MKYCQMCGADDVTVFPLHYNGELPESIRYSCLTCAANALGDAPAARALPAGRLLVDMREWAADCSWGDVDAEEVLDMDAARILRGVKRHFDGGVRAFLEASVPATEVR